MRDIKIEIMFWVHKQNFTKEMAKHYTTVERLTSGKDKFKYNQVDIIARRQYTGLKDKNGVEIYEGDVFFDGIENCTIEWCDESASFVANDGTEKHALGEWTNHDEVIGNIHQNPELLGN